jgi:hypothetical protein
MVPLFIAPASTDSRCRYLFEFDLNFFRAADLTEVDIASNTSPSPAFARLPQARSNTIHIAIGGSKHLGPYFLFLPLVFWGADLILL